MAEKKRVCIIMETLLVMEKDSHEKRHHGIVYDFCITYEKARSASAVAAEGRRKYKTRVPRLSLNEILTIILIFQRSSLNNFKHFYML